MTEWSLKTLLQSLHDEIEARPSLRPLAPVLVFLAGAWLAAAALILIRLV